MGTGMRSYGYFECLAVYSAAASGTLIPSAILAGLAVKLCHNILRPALVRLAIVCTIVLSLSPLGFATEKRPTTGEDCICLKRVVQDEVSVSPDGQRVAYILKAPNTVTNQNEYQIRVREFRETEHRTNGPIAYKSYKKLSGLKWLADAQRVVVLEGAGEKSGEVLIVNLRDLKAENVGRISTSILSYAVDPKGELLAYLRPSRMTNSDVNAERAARGYAIPFGWPKIRVDEEHPAWGKFEIEMLRRSAPGVWKKGILPLSGVSATGQNKTWDGLQGGSWISLSPNGAYLAFAYAESFNFDPSSVGQSTDNSAGTSPTKVLEVFDLRKDKPKCQLKFNFISSVPGQWAGDSSTFSFVATPHGEAGERNMRRLLALDLRTHEVSEVLGPDTWTGSSRVLACRNELCVETVSGEEDVTFRKLRRAGSQWKETDSTRIAKGTLLTSASTIDGETLVAMEVEPSTPPDLVAYHVTSGKLTVLTDLNPQFRNLSLGQVEKLEWTNRFGAKTWGNLIRPVGYKPGQKYPLVIMTKGWAGTFICDTEYRTAFPPQPLANAGFLVLEANPPEISKEFPSAVATPGEAENWVAMVESAVDLLDQHGMIDRDNVGIMGFSRTSWEVDFMLTHADFKFRAASSADSGIYNYGGYWLGQNIAQGFREEEHFYGGPPYDETLKNWIKYAPAFSAGRVKTPLLMEYMGFGSLQEPVYAYELFTALRRLGKPVELFFYPNGEHELDTPFERVASLQRNVDWFRFWMQGYVNKAPKYDPDQYTRWRKLREVQHANEKPAQPSTAFPIINERLRDM